MILRFPLGGALLLAAATAYASESVLFYNKPATKWVQSLPIGSGRLGATLHGKTDQDTIVLNEDSFWSGGFLDRVNSKALEAFPKVRDLMDDGKLTEAATLWSSDMSAVPKGQRKYEPAGYLRLSTGHDQDRVSGYLRSLDLETGIANSTYSLGNVTYAREAVSSAVDNVIAFRFTADRPNSYDMTIQMDRGSNINGTADDEGGLWISSSGKDDKEYTHSQYAMVSISGGSMTSSGSSINIRGATNVTIIWDAETLFYHPEGRTSYEKVLRDRVKSATSKGYAAIKSAAVADHQKYYTRASFTTGPGSDAAVSKQPTDSRLADLKKAGSFQRDPGMLALGYNYGRYMLISSSRPDSLPANLQGVWNDRYNPPWDSKFTININLEMNYWLADINGLNEMLEPLWAHLRRMETRGSDVATKMYGLPGWVCHHNTDLWGDCAPQDSSSQWATWPMGGAWMLQTALDHYRYSQDVGFAKGTLLPLLQNAVKFYNKFSVLEDGYYVTYPSDSPENSYFIPPTLSTAGAKTGIDKSPQSDRTLMWHLYTGFIEISSVAGSTEGVEDAKKYLAQLKAPDVSSTTGRLLEWSQDFRETEPGHRHFSPLIGLHPGHQYSPLTNASLTQAAQRFVQHRMDSGGGGEGWSRIWASALYARLLDGNKALNSAQILMSRMFDNLFSVTSGIYQADANFGLSAAVNEMFLQSQAGVVHIGPAMPQSGLQKGSFTGWKARGGFTVDAEWENSQIVGANVKSGNGGKLALRVQDERAFSVNGNTYNGPIDTAAGSSYKISF